MKNLLAKVELLPEETGDRNICTLLMYDDGTYTSSFDSSSTAYWKIEDGILNWKRYPNDVWIPIPQNHISFGIANKIMAEITNALEFNKHVLGEVCE